MEEESLDPPDAAVLGDRLRHAMADRNLGGEAFALRVGVSKNTVSSWLTDKHSPSRAHSERIAAVLEITVDELFGRPPTETIALPTGTTAATREAQQLVERLAELGDAGTALRQISTAVPPLLEILGRAQALAERWSDVDSG